MDDIYLHIFTLLKKMKAYRIMGAVMQSVQDFLANRTFQVKVGEELSGPRSVLSGVPQGSVLGPHHFYLYK